MIKYYFNTAPNPRKVSLCLEEMGLPYELMPVDTRRGDQHTAAFRAVNPNGKVPAIDDDGVLVFDSNAILLYLGEKTGQFMGQPADRGALLSWLMFIASGLGPFCGQRVHFTRVHTDSAYATNRYMREAERHYDVLDARLAQTPYLAGQDYTIADMAAWGWVTAAPFVFASDDPLARWPNVKRWFETIEARPAAQRARKVGAGHPFKTENDEEAKRHMFPSNYPAAA